MKHCGNCIHYIDGYCWAEVNNMDPSLFSTQAEKRDEDDICEEWEHDLLNDEE